MHGSPSRRCMVIGPPAPRQTEFPVLATSVQDRCMGWPCSCSCQPAQWQRPAHHEHLMLLSICTQIAHRHDVTNSRQRTLYPAVSATRSTSPPGHSTEIKHSDEYTWLQTTSRWFSHKRSAGRLHDAVHPAWLQRLNASSSESAATATAADCNDHRQRHRATTTWWRRILQLLQPRTNVTASAGGPLILNYNPTTPATMQNISFSCFHANFRWITVNATVLAKHINIYTRSAAERPSKYKIIYCRTDR